VSQIPSVDAFVDHHLELLELERREEVEEARRMMRELSDGELQKRGVALLKLKIADDDVGLGGRTLLVLEPSSGYDLPAHRMSPGDIVTVRTHGSDAKVDDSPTGVIWRVRSGAITVALDDSDASVSEPVRLDRVANDITYRRLRDALGKLQSYSKGPASRLREVSFGQREPYFEEPGRAEKPLVFFDESLDESQKEAVRLTLTAKEIALIHGPPGTGKTTALVEAIRQAVTRGERVVACAPSNVAVDNLVERLARSGVKVVRLGHPARLLPSVVDHSLDALVADSEGSKIADDVRKEIRQASRELRRARDWSERRERRSALGQLRRELREIEDWTVKQVVEGAQVVLTTLTGSANKTLEGTNFDLVVIDEAAQAIEASCWIPLLRAKRAVLAGDHLQLPPTVVSRKAERDGLAVTLFERLIERYGDTITRMLNVQYRMHETIMNWSSEALYDGKIIAHDSVATHCLHELGGVTETDDSSPPMIHIDTAGCDYEEERDADGDSLANAGEAGLVKTHLLRLFEAGVLPSDIAVITPYNAQVGELRTRLSGSYPDLEIGSVDGFQGREKEAVIISLVRSNDRGDVGFLADRRRLNVAVTRARRHVTIIGDSATVSNDPFLAGLVEYLGAFGEYRSAWEYQ